MAENTPPTYPNNDQLAAQALDHIVRIFAGNGVKKDAITLVSHTITTHTLNASTHLEIKPVYQERQMPGKVAVGQMAGSRDEAMKSANHIMQQAATNSAMKAKLTEILLQRPDQGFGLKKQVLAIPFIKQDFTWHDACNACHGTSRSVCAKCMGRKLETCIKCNGRTMMFCPMCRGTGLLQGNSCPRCKGNRYVPCDGCQRSGMMGCRLCNQTGQTKCGTCNGIGYKSNVLTLAAEAMAQFEYDAPSIPKHAADAIETHGPALASTHAIKLKGRVADERETVLGASYEVTFPAGEMVFDIGGTDVKAQMFGYKAALTGLPHLLDKLLGPSVRDLEETAKDGESVAKTIKAATRYKILARAFLMTQKLSPKKVADQLAHHYDVGISAAMIEKIAHLANQTSAKISEKPRYVGLGLGLLATAVLCGLYYLTPLRHMLGSMLPNPALDIILDIFPIVLCGVLTTYAIRYAGAKSIQTAIGHLVPADKRKTITARAQTLGVWGYVGAAIVCLILMECSTLMGYAKPHWVQMILP